MAADARGDGGPTSDRTLYARVLGPAWLDLPLPVRAMHAARGVHLARGRAEIERGRGFLAKLIAALSGFPTSSADVGVEVRFDASEEGETWTRSFAGRSFSSVQFAGPEPGLLCERLGAVMVTIRPAVAAGRMDLPVRRWSLLGLSLPAWAAPRADAWEDARDGRFWFHVRLSHPLAGLIIRYEGWLEPVDA